jgi:hypothetical protein
MTDIRPIPGLPDYFADSHGQIWSAKSGCHSRFHSLHILKSYKDRRGYLHVVLYRDGERKRRYSVHTLVALAFHGPRPHGTVVCHCNDDPQDNSPGNLYCDTQQSNVGQAITRGRFACGDRSHLAKVTDQDCLAMLALLSQGRAVREVASRFGVSVGHVYSLRRGEFRKHLFRAA